MKNPRNTPSRRSIRHIQGLDDAIRGDDEAATELPLLGGVVDPVEGVDGVEESRNEG
ncbi:MAG: hypothetical protein WBI10_03345 [Syntrophales bacterium]